MAVIEHYIGHNFSDRRSRPFVHVVHYTGSNNVHGTLNWFSRNESRVSAHEVIDSNGDRYLIVPKDKKAWHAGVSNFYSQEYPNGKAGVNDFSFGYELVGVYGTDFTDEQYNSLAEAIMEIIYDDSFSRATIKNLWENIVGHEHIAPRRKIDPGPTFSWLKLYKNIKRINREEHIAPRRKIDPGPIFSWLKLYKNIKRINRDVYYYKYDNKNKLPLIIQKPPIIKYLRDNYTSTREIML